MMGFGKLSSLSCVVPAILVCLISAPALGVTINVDFNVTNTNATGTHNGLGAAPDTEAYWNGLAPAGATSGSAFSGVTSYVSPSLLASDGITDTGVTVTLGASPSTSTFVGYDVLPMGNLLAGYLPDLLNDFIWVDSTRDLTFTINGLVDNGVYDLYIYSQNGGHVSENNLFVVNGIAPDIPTRKVLWGELRQIQRVNCRGRGH